MATQTYAIRNSVDVAWASGLFEGEGCFTVSTNQTTKYHRPQATLSSTDLDVLERFQRTMGFGTINGPYWMKDSTKPIWRWTVSSFERFQATVGMLWSGLGTRRRARAVELLALPHGNKGRKNGS